MDLGSWLKCNRDRLGSEYEHLFVKKVLSRLPEFNPRTLSAQHPFVDAQGKRRYCDFTIEEGADLRIAIEIDGYDKRGTGQGMTRAEFVDWERRQASLTSQGWRVLRFANVDVRDQPAVCAEHLSLLLRLERSKMSHQRQLEERIRRLESELARSAETPKSSNDDRARQEELETLRDALRNAREATRLSPEERDRLDELQRKALFFEKETNVMKTTIWALTTLLAVFLVLLFFDRPQFAPAEDTSSPVGMMNAAASAKPGSHAISPTEVSCAQSMSWKEASNHLGETVAVLGPVTRVADRADVRGQPVFITLGEEFPSSKRVDVVIWGSERPTFSDVLATTLEGRDVCLLGELTERDGVPQMVLRERTQLQIR